jgi:hypothetical protein
VNHVGCRNIAITLTIDNEGEAEAHTCEMARLRQRSESVPRLYLSFCASGVSYSVTTVTLATAFAAGFSSLIATM